MDNSNIGAAMEAAYLRDSAKNAEQRIASLEKAANQLQLILLEHLAMHCQEEKEKRQATANAKCEDAVRINPDKAQTPQDQQSSTSQPLGWFGYIGDAGGPLK